MKILSTKEYQNLLEENETLRREYEDLIENLRQNGNYTKTLLIRLEKMKKELYDTKKKLALAYSRIGGLTKGNKKYRENKNGSSRR